MPSNDEPPARHPTVRLTRGRHSSAEHGACVLELASVLASEPFSDHPHFVCPVIGAFLRAYNDRLDDRRRQDLYQYAARTIGTRSSAAIERERAHMCRDWPRRATADARPARRPFDIQPRWARLPHWLQR